MTEELSQLARLARPIPAKYVKPPAQGKYGNYCDHEIITQILLKIVGPFSFQVEKVITNPDGLVDGCTASLTATIDGREVTVTEAGDCEHADKKKTQGDRLKNAASDALKRCAMRMGLGLHIWAGDEDYFLFDQLWKAAREPDDEDRTLVAVSTELRARAIELGLAAWIRDQGFEWPWSKRVCDAIRAKCQIREEELSAPFEPRNEDGTAAPSLLSEDNLSSGDRIKNEQPSAKVL